MKGLKGIGFIYFSLIAVLFSVGCDKDGDSNDNLPTEYKIQMSPEEILLNDDETGLLYLSIQPQAEFQWNITSKPDWLKVKPSSGTGNDQIIEIELIPDNTGLKAGSHSGEIEIITDIAGKKKINIELSVDGRPIAEVNPEEIIFSGGESQKVITISNIGTGFLNWEFQSLPDWIHLNPQSGRTNEGNKVEIVATAQISGLEAGTLADQLVLVSNSEKGDIDVDVSLEVPEMAIMTISESVISFGYFEAEKSFFIKNDGNVEFNWEWDDNSNSFISVNTSSGSLAIGDSIEISMTIDRTELITDTYDLEVFINNNKDQATGLNIQINHFEEKKWIIHGRVIDAEYNRRNDILVVVSENPYELRVFDISNNTVESVALNKLPTSLSVGLNGDHAVVGHDGSFSYINLSTMEVENNYEVSTKVFDIILAPNNWVYVFPTGGVLDRIRCFNLSTGEKTLHTGNSIGLRRAKLHFSGRFIYAATRGSSPGNFEKYDISNGTAEYLYRSPYHGTYAFSGDIWISDNGNRLYAKSRNVFNASNIQNNDIIYSGELVGTGQVKTLDHSSPAQRVYAIFYSESSWNPPPWNEIRKYLSNPLTFLGTIKLPGFLIPDGSGDGNIFKSQGHFGFFNSNGTKFHVIVKAEEGSGALNEWAIVSVDVE